MIAVHNHPKSGPPSAADIYSAYERSYKIGIIMCHNGGIYGYKANDELYESDLANVEILLGKLLINDKKTRQKAMKRLSKKYGIEVII